MARDISVSLRWVRRIDLRDLINEKVSCPELDDKNQILYMIHYWARVLYLGKVGLTSSVRKRIRRHHVIPKIAINYPDKPVKLTCAEITYCNLNRRTKQLVSALENIIIQRYEPEFNIQAKNSFSCNYRSIKIKNYGDYYPLKENITF